MVTLDTTQSAAASAASPAPPTDTVVCPFVVLVDTREQHPWTFGGLTVGKTLMIVPRETRTLATGDYAIDGYQSQCVIERKSAGDLVGSVGAGHQRFEREHKRMLLMTVERGGQACVIVEGCLSAILHELESDGRYAARNTLLGCVRSWPFKYRVPWFFAGDRRAAEELAFLVLLKWWEKRLERRTEANAMSLFH